MMNYSRIINDVRSVYEAALSGENIAGSIEAFDADTFCMPEVPDDAVLQGWYERPFAPAPNQLRVADIDELGLAICALGRIGDLHFDSRDVTGVVAHEEQHQQAYLRLGARATFFGMTVTARQLETGEYGVGFQAFAGGHDLVREVTKIEVASVLAAPDVLAEGDLRRVQQMGYADRDDVMRRLEAL